MASGSVGHRGQCDCEGSVPTFMIGVLAYPQLKKEWRLLCQSLERGLQHEVQVVGPLYLSQGRDCLPGPPAWPFRVLPPAPLGPPLEKNQSLGPGSCLFVPNISWKQTLATQPGGHRHTQPRTPAEQSRADRFLRFSLSLLRSVYGLARGEVGKNKASRRTWQWGDFCLETAWETRALAGSLLILLPGHAP